MNPKSSIFTVIFLFFSLLLEGQNEGQLSIAIDAGDFYKVIEIADQNKELEQNALDALCCYFQSYEYQYEDILKMLSACCNSALITSFLNNIKLQKEENIIDRLSDMTMEDICNYHRKYPFRRTVVYDFLEETIMKNLDRLTYQELDYMLSALPILDSNKIEEEINTRVDEKQALVAQNAHDFIKNEQQYTTTILYVLEKIIWRYFKECQSQLAEHYSQIPMVSDDAREAANQYQQLLKICMSPEILKELLQKKVDEYCMHINEAREIFAFNAGERKIVKFEYEVPTISISSTVSTEPLKKIKSAREDFVKNRNIVSKGSGVLGWVMGGLWGLGTKAIGDWISIESLVSTEYDARKKYMMQVYNSVFDSFTSYTQECISEFKMALLLNEQQYENIFNK